MTGGLPRSSHFRVESPCGARTSPNKVTNSSPLQRSRDRKARGRTIDTVGTVSIDTIHLALLRRALALSGLRRVGNGLLVRHDLVAVHDGERAEHLADVAPPLLAELLVPLDRDAQPVGEAHLLVPAELTEFSAVDGVPVVVERPVVRVFDPLGKFLWRRVRDAELREESAAELQVADLVV